MAPETSAPEIEVFPWDISERDQVELDAWNSRIRELPHLYRFVSIRGVRFEWFSEIITNDSIYFPRYRELNDPSDGATRPTSEGPRDEKIRYWERYLREEHRPIDDAAREQIGRIIAAPDLEEQWMRRAHDEELERLGILSLTETWDNERMWSEYADGHRGVCIRLNTQRLAIRPWNGCAPPMRVTYETDYPPSLSFYSDTRFRRSRVITATKAMEWSHEREWRILRTAGFGYGPIDPPSLDGIILGAEIAPSDEDRIRNLLSGRWPLILKARWRNDRIGLEVEPT